MITKIRLLPCLFGALSVISANAQLPVAKLTMLFPPGAKVGTTVNMSVAGADLDGLEKVFFAHAGITGKVDAAGKNISVTVAKNVPEGIYDVWVAGQYGASNPRSIQVSGLTEVPGVAGNHSLEKAQSVAANSVLNGAADKEAVDHYRVALKKGQRLLVRCLDKSIDSQLAGVVTLCDASGRELARAANEQITEHSATADTTVVVKVNDRVFRGSSYYFYRLQLTTGALVDYTLPLAVKPGSKAKVKAFGPAGVREIEVSAPAANGQLPAGVALTDYQATATGFGHGGSLIGFAEAPIILETEPNNDANKPQAIKLPCDISGQFHPARDRDYYTFDAKKGEVYRVEIVSHRLGLPTDPLVVIQKVDKAADGKISTSDVLTLGDSDRNFGGVDFDTFHRDDDARLEIKVDGTYRVMARDLFNGVKSDPRRVYRLIIRKESPDYLVVAHPVSRKVKGDRRDVWQANTLLRQGDVEALNVLVFRRDGFSGEITIEAKGLPAGVSHAPLKFTGSSKSGMLLLRASESAEKWAGPVKIVGRAKIGDQTVERQARIGAANWDVDFSNSTTEKARVRLSDRLILAIADEVAPLELIPGAAKPIEAVVGSKVTVPVKVARRGEFAADLKVKPYGHSSLAKVPDSTVKKESGNVVIDLKKYKLPAGTHQLFLKTNSKGKYRKVSKEIKTAQAAAKVASDAAAVAEKHAKALAAVAKIKGLSAEQVAAVNKEADEAAEVAKDLIGKRDVAQKKAKDLAAKVKPKDLTVEFYSMPFLVTVKKK